MSETGPIMHVVAVGARTPVGLRAESAAAAVRGGIGRMAGHPFLLDGAGEPLVCALDPRLDPKVLGRDRLVALLAPALWETAGKLGRARPATALPSELPLLLALPETRPGFTEDDAKWVAWEMGNLPIALREGITIRLKVEIVGRGHAGAFRAIEEVGKRLARWPRDLQLVAGVDCYLEADTLDWLKENRQILREGVRSGFQPGEAAGVLALADDGGRRAWALPSLATIRGVATSHEERPIRGELEVLGDGLGRAIAGATSGLRLPAEAVDTIYGDLNGERYRTTEWGFAVLREQRAMRDTTCERPSNFWGDVGAASAALGVMLATQAWARGYAKGPRALVWAGSEGGLRGAAVVAKADAR